MTGAGLTWGGTYWAPRTSCISTCGRQTAQRWTRRAPHTSATPDTEALRESSAAGRGRGCDPTQPATPSGNRLAVLTPTPGRRADHRHRAHLLLNEVRLAADQDTVNGMRVRIEYWRVRIATIGIEVRHEERIRAVVTDRGTSRKFGGQATGVADYMYRLCIYNDPRMTRRRDDIRVHQKSRTEGADRVLRFCRVGNPLVSVRVGASPLLISSPEPVIQLITDINLCRMLAATLNYGDRYRAIQALSCSLSRSGSRGTGCPSPCGFRRTRRVIAGVVADQVDGQAHGAHPKGGRSSEAVTAQTVSGTPPSGRVTATKVSTDQAFHERGVRSSPSGRQWLASITNTNDPAVPDWPTTFHRPSALTLTLLPLPSTSRGIPKFRRTAWAKATSR